MSEFELIRHYFSALAPLGAGVVLGIGDDAALLAVPPGQHLVVTTDMLVAGRHFPEDTAPADIGWKSLAVNLSDLAAMGADARWLTLALSLPAFDRAWLEGFCEGFAALAREAGVALVGGDTTRGPLTLSVTAMGCVAAGAALRRDGARPGDRICVTGPLGDAAAALALMHSTAEPQVSSALRSRLDRPNPRLAAGRALRGLAHAAIDVSDGLLADLGHLCAASEVGAELEAARLPASNALQRAVPDAARRLELQAAGGDDYELCVCIPPGRLAEAVAACPDLVPIGRIVARPGVRLLDRDGKLLQLSAQGFDHFS